MKHSGLTIAKVDLVVLESEDQLYGSLGQQHATVTARPISTAPAVDGRR